MVLIDGSQRVLCSFRVEVLPVNSTEKERGAEERRRREKRRRRRKRCISNGGGVVVKKLRIKLVEEAGADLKWREE